MKTLLLLAVLGIAGCSRQPQKDFSAPNLYPSTPTPKESAYTPTEETRTNFKYVHSHDCRWLFRLPAEIRIDSYGNHSIIQAMNGYDCRDGKSIIVLEQAKP